MRRLPAALLLATALVATPCLAASSTRMSWDHCAADGRVANRTFACDTNAGSELLVGSFEMDQASTQVSGEEVTIDVVSSAATMPAWWQYMDPATCRRTSLTWLTAPSPGPSACVDAF